MKINKYDIFTLNRQPELHDGSAIVISSSTSNNIGEVVTIASRKKFLNGHLAIYTISREDLNFKASELNQDEIEKLNNMLKDNLGI